MALKSSFTGDITDLQRSTQAARDEFRQVGAEAGKTSRELRAAGSAFDGTRLEGQALRAARGVEKVGGVTRLTTRELQQVSRTVNEAMQKFDAMGVRAPAAVQKLSRELQQAQRSASGMSTSVSQALGAFSSGPGIGAGAGVGLAAITSMGSALREVASQGAKLGPLRQGFDLMQGGAEAAQRQLDRMRLTTRGLVDDLALMTAANRGALLGLTDMGIDMAELAGIATTLGRAVGQDAAKSTDDLTVALARQSPMILDNLGIKMSLSDANALRLALGQASAHGLSTYGWSRNGSAWDLPDLFDLQARIEQHAATWPRDEVFFEIAAGTSKGGADDGRLLMTPEGFTFIGDTRRETAWEDVYHLAWGTPISVAMIRCGTWRFSDTAANPLRGSGSPIRPPPSKRTSSPRLSCAASVRRQHAQYPIHSPPMSWARAIDRTHSSLWHRRWDRTGNSSRRSCQSQRIRTTAMPSKSASRLRTSMSDTSPACSPLDFTTASPSAIERPLFTSVPG